MRWSCRQWLIATCPSESTMGLTPRPFLHLGQKVAGAQERSRCSPPRRNDLDRAPALWRAVRSDTCRSLPETTGPTNVGLACKASDKESDLANRLSECHQHSTGTQSTSQGRPHPWSGPAAPPGRPRTPTRRAAGHIGTASYTSTLPPDCSTGQPSAFFVASARDSALMIE